MSWTTLLMESKYLPPSTFTVILMVVCFGRAQVKFPGKCNTVSVVDSFDIQAYEGIWYEIEKYPTSMDSNGKCVYTIYTDNGDGTIGVRHAHVSNETGEFNQITGTARLTDPNGRSGKLSVTFPTISDREAPYWILSTDYQFYSIVWSCTNQEQDNIQFLWYLSRTLNPEDGERKSVRDFMKILGLNTTTLIATNQSRCPSPLAII